MSAFLRLKLAGRLSRLQPNDTILVNTDHIVRIHPTWPHGATVVLSDDTSLNVRPNLDEIHARLQSTGGRAHVYTVEHAACGDIDAIYEAARADLLP